MRAKKEKTQEERAQDGYDKILIFPLFSYNRYKTRCEHSFVNPIPELIKNLEIYLERYCDIVDGRATLNDEKMKSGAWAKDPIVMCEEYNMTNFAKYESRDTTTRLHWMVIDWYDLWEDENPVKWTFKDYIELLNDCKVSPKAYKADAVERITEFVKSRDELALEAYTKLGYERTYQLKFSKARIKKELAKL